MAKRWIEENEELVKLLSHTMRMISPPKYARGLEAGETMSNKVWSEPLF